MFLHVGNNKNIREKDIIGIFDTDNATLSPITKKYLARAEKDGLVDTARQDIPKSFVAKKLFNEEARFVGMKVRYPVELKVEGKVKND